MEKVQGGVLKQIIKGTALSVISSLIGILLFALLLSFVTLPSTAVKAVNQFIKVLSVFLGCFFCVKGDKGIIKGLLVGIFWAILLSLIFLIFGNKFENFTSVLLDILFGVIVGMISGILSVNLRR